MVKQAVRCLLLCHLVVVAGCAGDMGDAVPRVTIDVRCGATADCPRGFSCVSDLEHGPPITLCESTDPGARCPAGYDTKVVYGQTLCKSRVSITRAPRGDRSRQRHTAP